MTYLATHLGSVGALTLAHLALVGVSLCAACALALPAGVAIAYRPRLATAVLALLGAVYTIPSLALLALLVPLLGLGRAPAFVALVLYAQFILVRNVVTALRGVPPAQRDAAVGLGFSPRQRLLRVELPLAFPVILGGVRLAAVSMIAIATLAAYVDGGGLGTLIFRGFALQNTDLVIAGALPSALLAIAADASLRALERAVRV